MVLGWLITFAFVVAFYCCYGWLPEWSVVILLVICVIENLVGWLVVCIIG